MCNFFSCIVTRKLEVLFCESDSHDEIIRRAGLDDSGNIVRAEYTKRDYDNRELLHAEAPEMPIWVERQINVITDLVRAKFKRVYPLRAKYNKIMEPAEEEYNKIKEPAWEEYNKIKKSAREECIAKLKRIAGYVS